MFKSIKPETFGAGDEFTITGISKARNVRLFIYSTKPAHRNRWIEIGKVEAKDGAFTFTTTLKEAYEDSGFKVVTGSASNNWKWSLAGKSDDYAAWIGTRATVNLRGCIDCIWEEFEKTGKTPEPI